MTTANEDVRVVSATREIAAPAGRIFELIADPTQQPRWDGNNNLAEAPPGQRVRAQGDAFTMTTTKQKVKTNYVVEFDEGRRIAWEPADAGEEPAGHVWRWELEAMSPTRTRVTHTYDWTGLKDERKLDSARSRTPQMLKASLDRLADLAERAEQPLP
jgi:uncharacterized protein YndB with AHSA1/START domain